MRAGHTLKTVVLCAMWHRAVAAQVNNERAGEQGIQYAPFENDFRVLEPIRSARYSGFAVIGSRLERDWYYGKREGGGGGRGSREK